MALGATRASVIRLVLGRVALLVVGGIVADEANYMFFGRATILQPRMTLRAGGAAAILLAGCAYTNRHSRTRCWSDP